MSRGRRFIPRIADSTSGLLGLVMLTFVLAVAFLGPAIAPHTITATLGPPAQGPSGDLPLGTDELGRDVLSRVLNGGHSVVLMATGAILAAYIVGMGIGMTAGYTRSLLDPILMRSVDVLLAFPALLVLLLLVSGLGTHVLVLMFGAALVLVPGISRLTRTATLEVSTRGYVEAAVARGEGMRSVLLREVLPNITPVILADVGIRYGYSIVLIASMNFLGLGLAPPSADWGLMISENRSLIGLNPWAVLAPGIMLGLLAVSVNLIADAYVRTLGRSSRRLLAREGEVFPVGSDAFVAGISGDAVDG